MGRDKEFEALQFRPSPLLYRLYLIAVFLCHFSFVWLHAYTCIRSAHHSVFPPSLSLSHTHAHTRTYSIATVRIMVFSHSFLLLLTACNVHTPLSLSVLVFSRSETNDFVLLDYSLLLFYSYFIVYMHVFFFFFFDSWRWC